MSFDAVRTYPRHILASLGLLDDDKATTTPTRRTPCLPQTTSPLWTSTTHTFLGATPRTVPRSWTTSRFSEDPSGIPDDRAHDVQYDPQSADARSSGSADAEFSLYEREQRKEGGDQGREVSVSPPPPLLVVKRYTPRKRAEGKGITLLFLPGMGMPKEICEPLIDIILPKLTEAGVAIDEIWALDMPMSGETALANPPGYLYGNEKDITRDILHFLTAYLPVSPGDDTLPTALPYRPPHSSQPAQSTRANLHVVAHSLGAQATILCGSHAPQLFSSMVLFDPAIVPPGKVLDGFRALPNDVFCTMLPERYASRDALRSALRSNKRLGGWDDRIVEVFVQRGVIRDTERGEGEAVRLCAPPRLEWALYYDKETPSHAFDRISDLRTPLLAIMPSRPFATPPKVFSKLFEELPMSEGDKRLVWIKDASHQVIYERLDKGAEELLRWLKDRAGSTMAKL